MALLPAMERPAVAMSEGRAVPTQEGLAWGHEMGKGVRTSLVSPDSSGGQTSAHASNKCMLKHVRIRGGKGRTLGHTWQVLSSAPRAQWGQRWTRLDATAFVTLDFHQICILKSKPIS